MRTPDRHAWQRLASRAVALGVAVGAVAGCTAGPGPDPVPTPGTTVAASPSGGAATPAPTGTLPPVPVQAAVAPPPEAVVAPVRLQVPDLALDMPVDAVGVAADGSMEVPPDADRAGWYRFGPGPASTEGTTLLAGHVDSRLTGIGPFADLRRLTPGAQVQVTTSDGTVRPYVVVDVTKVPKETAPLADWFSRDGAPRLVLVTCGGTWREDVGHYTDNVVVTAEPR